MEADQVEFHSRTHERRHAPVARDEAKGLRAVVHSKKAVSPETDELKAPLPVTEPHLRNDNTGNVMLETAPRTQLFIDHPDETSRDHRFFLHQTTTAPAGVLVPFAPHC